MRELHAILDTWRSLQGRDADAVLATVVHVTGSAYRRPGGRMLMVPDGRRVGCVSGGCLEGEIVRKAWWFTESGESVIRIYDTTSDEDALWEFGLGCNGVVHVMLERVNTPAAAAMLEFLQAKRTARKPAVVATVIQTDAGEKTFSGTGIRVGDRLLFDGSSGTGSLSESEIQIEVTSHAAAAFRERKSRLAHIGATDVFIEWVAPALSLIVFGAGHDAIPLVNFATQLGWGVSVADGRPAYARSERFPGATVLPLNPEDPLRDIGIGPDTAVVMMTHNYPLDLQLLPSVISARPRYLGLLGPRKRAERLFSELALSEPSFVHAPAGLDAGCDSPEAIALSIVAEIQAETNSRGGGKLKHRREPIHNAVFEVGIGSHEASREHPAAAAVRPAYCETIAGTHA